MRSSSVSWWSKRSGSSHWNVGFMSLGFMGLRRGRGDAIARKCALILLLQSPRSEAQKTRTRMPRSGRITLEDLWKLDRPAQPTLSPDGAQVCVSVSSHDMEQNQARSSLWLLSAFGGEPRRLTSCGEKDGEPRWSPDGRWIAFVAKRAGVGTEKGDEEAQVYLIAPDGGEARRLTDI